MLRSKRIGVTSMTFRGHVTSSVTYVTIWFPVGQLLLVVLWNQACIS